MAARIDSFTCTNSTAEVREALIALEFRGLSFHDPFHAGGRCLATVREGPNLHRAPRLACAC
jgi:hypothetical protein